MSITHVKIGSVTIGGEHPMALMAGPCVMESRSHTLELAQEIKHICDRLKVPLIFKASFDKANRSTASSFRGPGLKEGLSILADVRQRVKVPVLSDIHEPDQASPASEILDMIQIPAFLCRQTDLLVAAGRTQKPVNVKKGQFMSPEEMANVVDKLVSVGNRQITLTERGTFFGYHRLVNDMTAIPKMQKYAPVVFDATHSCQLPGGLGHQSGGQREFVQTLAWAALATGADALFLEVHDRPDQAQSDSATILPLNQLSTLLETGLAIHRLVRSKAS